MHHSPSQRAGRKNCEAGKSSIAETAEISGMPSPMFLTMEIFFEAYEKNPESCAIATAVVL